MSTKRSTRLNFRSALPLFLFVVVVLVLLSLNASVSDLSINPSSHLPSYPHKQKPLPKCAMLGRAKSFLIVFMGNSGSTAISTELRAHPQTYMEKLEYVSEYEKNVTASLAATRAFFAKGVAKGLTPGFKIRPGHIIRAPEEWKALAREFDTRIIWNYRKNVIKATLTEYVKTVLNDSHGVGGLRQNISVDQRCELGEGCRYRLDMPKFHEMLKRGLKCNNEIITGVSMIDQERRCVWEVPYEDYLHNRDETVQRVQQFLGLERMVTAPTRFKGTRDNLCEVILNYDELCERLYGCTIWQEMLEDGLNQCYCERYVVGSGQFCDINLH